MPSGRKPMPLPPLGCRVDPDAFAQLLDMAGPDLAPSLMRQMRQDLWQIARALTQAVDPPDHDAIRRQTHILSAISGSAGAYDLQDAAQALGLATHADPPDTARLHSHAAKLLEGLYGLIRYTEAALP